MWIVMMTEPGGAYFDDQEAAAARLFTKGGFLWATTSGAVCLEFWTSQLRKGLAAPTIRS